MGKVYFKRVTSNESEALSSAAQMLLEKVVATKGHVFSKEVPIKVHFGEKGNTTFVPATCYEGIIETLKKNKVQPSFIETNVLYRGSRTTRESHIELAKSHGFTALPIIIADGDHGEAYDEVEIHKTYFEACKIGHEFSKYDQFIVTSHFKGHGMAGFGGAMKQLAMGFAARGGKLAQHSGISPTVKASKCIACGLCIQKCDVNAIDLGEKAVIDPEKCVGCAGCIAVCPVGAIRNDWSGKNFREKVAEYAYGAQKGKDNIYITFLINVTEECDCMGEHMKPIAKDIGVFASDDPVAIDVACLDMLQKEHGHPVFETGRATIKHAVEIGLGTDQVELEEI
ncbi:DUF362 domain-containing protein [Fusibacter ferrireducens]|uniref:Ferredoxin n=1 Tax=Fusibacter ferrireducens TaxID=2785058 RepID=A0ABR9ZTJ1_9FIRM|nr:DUF362 domain-containing protein [Fusibacter ferrireducens]MBF4692884.1 DUF362 domain-containing protein [Fusibacter ferrireducens]